VQLWAAAQDTLEASPQATQLEVVSGRVVPEQERALAEKQVALLAALVAAAAMVR
jgi:hypothetical protein